VHARAGRVLDAQLRAGPQRPLGHPAHHGVDVLGNSGWFSGRQIMSPREVARSSASQIVTDIGANACSTGPPLNRASSQTRRKGPAKNPAEPLRTGSQKRLVVNLRTDVPLAFEVEDDLVGGFFGGQVFGVDHYFSVGRLFVGVGDAGELLEDSSPSLGV